LNGRSSACCRPNRKEYRKKEEGIKKGMVMSKDKEFEQLIDYYEKNILQTIQHGGPEPYLTDLTGYCRFCGSRKSRTGLKLVLDLDTDLELPACFQCIEEQQLPVSTTRNALEFEAITQAILRLKSML
jgi:hypothetical protein